MPEKKKDYPKPKRKLSNISFEQEGAHIALVSKDQGGPANGAAFALTLKAAFSDEVIQKMQQVQVTMDLPDFLQRFFSMYYEDAEVLARLMGYVEPEDDSEDEMDWDEKYIQERLSSFTVLKSLHEAEDIHEILKGLNGEQYLALLQDQELVEKVLEKNSPEVASDTQAVNKAAEDDKPQIASEVKKEEVSTSVVNKHKEPKMTEKTQEVEMVEKAAFESLQKALEEQKVELQKALETIQAFEAEKKVAIEKARQEQVLAAVKDSAKADVLFKAVKDADDAVFAEVVKALGEMTQAIEKSTLFQEQGASTSVQEPAVQESAVAKLIKSQLKAAK